MFDNNQIITLSFAAIPTKSAIQHVARRLLGGFANLPCKVTNVLWPCLALEALLHQTEEAKVQCTQAWAVWRLWLPACKRPACQRLWPLVPLFKRACVASAQAGATGLAEVHASNPAWRGWDRLGKNTKPLSKAPFKPPTLSALTGPGGLHSVLNPKPADGLTRGGRSLSLFTSIAASSGLCLALLTVTSARLGAPGKEAGDSRAVLLVPCSQQHRLLALLCQTNTTVASPALWTPSAASREEPSHRIALPMTVVLLTPVGASDTSKEQAPQLGAGRLKRESPPLPSSLCAACTPSHTKN